MMIWLMFLCVGAITYLIRLSFITFLGKANVPSLVLKLLNFVPMAVLSAIILPQLFLPKNTFDISLGNPRWIAGIVAILVAWRTRKVLLTIVVGMITLWILQFLLK